MRRRFLAGMLVLYAAVVLVLIFGPQVMAKRTTPPLTTCTGTLAHATTNDIVVPAGAICRVSASTVNGSVTVNSDAYFEASGTQVFGNVRATGALTVFLHDGTSVTGSVLVAATPQFFLYKAAVAGTVKVVGALSPGFGHVQVCQTAAGQIEVRASGPDVLVGDPQGGCPGNTVKKDVVVAGNVTMSELQVSGNAIAGSLLVTGNTGLAPKHVDGNTVQGVIDLSGNASPFDSSN